MAKDGFQQRRLDFRQHQVIQSADIVAIELFEIILQGALDFVTQAVSFPARSQCGWLAVKCSVVRGHQILRHAHAALSLLCRRVSKNPWMHSSWALGDSR